MLFGCKIAMLDYWLLSSTTLSATANQRVYGDTKEDDFAYRKQYKHLLKKFVKTIRHETQANTIDATNIVAEIRTHHYKSRVQHEHKLQQEDPVEYLDRLLDILQFNITDNQLSCNVYATQDLVNLTPTDAILVASRQDRTGFIWRVDAWDENQHSKTLFRQVFDSGILDKPLRRQKDSYLRQVTHSEFHAKHLFFLHIDRTSKDGFITRPITIDIEIGNHLLTAILVHIGTSVDSGHFVAYLRKVSEWYLFDDARIPNYQRQEASWTPSQVATSCVLLLYA
jgi:hypothetical protein